MAESWNDFSGESEYKSGNIVKLSEEQEVQIFVKQMLAKRNFIGVYLERRYVQPLNSYRDVVSVSNTEDDLPRDLSIVKRRLQQFYPKCIWTGITGSYMPGAPVGVCLWVQLNNLPFGRYWFQIREVKYFENIEICLRLKCLRSINLDDEPVNPTVSRTRSSGSPASPEDETFTKLIANNVTPTIFYRNFISNIISINYTEVIMSWIYPLFVLFTLHNLRKVITFLLVLVLAVATGVVKLLTYSGEFSLKVMREVSIFIDTCTPLLLQIIDFFSKCVGGMLILFSATLRDSVSRNMFHQYPHMAPRTWPPLPNYRNRSFQRMHRQNNRYARQL